MTDQRWPMEIWREILQQSVVFEENQLEIDIFGEE